MGSIKDMHSDDISIQAPVKGATTGCRLRSAPDCYFNPRSREGSDDLRLVLVLSLLQFQSTLP